MAALVERVFEALQSGPARPVDVHRALADQDDDGGPAYRSIGRAIGQLVHAGLVRALGRGFYSGQTENFVHKDDLVPHKDKDKDKDQLVLVSHKSFIHRQNKDKDKDQVVLVPSRARYSRSPVQKILKAAAAAAFEENNDEETRDKDDLVLVDKDQLVLVSPKCPPLRQNKDKDKDDLVLLNDSIRTTSSLSLSEASNKDLSERVKAIEQVAAELRRERDQLRARVEALEAALVVRPEAEPAPIPGAIDEETERALVLAVQKRKDAVARGVRRAIPIESLGGFRRKLLRDWANDATEKRELLAEDDARIARERKKAEERKEREAMRAPAPNSPPISLSRLVELSQKVAPMVAPVTPHEPPELAQLRQEAAEANARRLRELMA